MKYKIGKDRQYRHFLYQKDCNTSILDVEINTTSSLTRMMGSYNSLSLAHSIDKAGIGNSTIWNELLSQAEVCQVVELFLNSTGNIMVVSRDVRNTTVGFNLTSDFRMDVNLSAPIINSSRTDTVLSSYIKARHCDGASMGVALADLGPNDVLRVCIYSTSPDIEINALNNMVSEWVASCI